jgi:hypothetical protein
MAILKVSITPAVRKLVDSGIIPADVIGEFVSVARNSAIDGGDEQGVGFATARFNETKLFAMYDGSTPKEAFVKLYSELPPETQQEFENLPNPDFAPRISGVKPL